MIPYSGQLIKARFLCRINRFVAQIQIGTEIALCHVPNTGRLKELLLVGVVVLVRISENPMRRTGYDLLAVKSPYGWMAVDTRLPNRLVGHGLEKGLLHDFGPARLLRAEVTFSKSRFDYLYGSIDSDDLWLIENKCCTLVEDGRARFPDAPTERGRRHMEELTLAVMQGYRTAVFFIIQCEYATSFAPNDQMDPKFCNALRIAADNGTYIAAYNCRVTEENICLNQQIPVYLQEKVAAE